MRKKQPRHKNQKAAEDIYTQMYSDMDDTFAFIAGYTPGGVPYGVTWEQVEEKVRLYMKQMEGTAEELTLDDSNELPFD